MFVINSECIKGMQDHIKDESIDAVVTDPPYGLSKQPDMSEVLKHWLNGNDYNHTGGGFMGKKWDSFVPGPAVWREVYRCLKPGGHALVFAGSRTQDLMTIALRLAGFEIRDVSMWLYGSGFPKSLNVGNGYGTALKPAYEPVIIARKPLIGTVAENVLKHGTGALNIDGCRIETGEITGWGGSGAGGNTWNDQNCGLTNDGESRPVQGRWPANIMHDGSDEVVELFPTKACASSGVKGSEPSNLISNTYNNRDRIPSSIHDLKGSAARFFYCPKTSKTDRNSGLDNFEHITAGECVDRVEGSAGIDNPRAGAGRTSGSKNNHPTVKPTELMRYLCRLVGYTNALIMDPFTGSGSTGRGAALEGFNFIGFEMDVDYCKIANARILNAYNKFYVDETNNKG